VATNGSEGHMTGIVYKCWTKAIRGDAGAPRRSARWILSRRAFLEVYPDRIECGDWVIPASEVSDAVLYETRQLFVVPVFVLYIVTAKTTYQFGVNPWVRIAAQLPFDVRRERVRLRTSPFSIALRIALIALLAYWLWERLRPC